MRNTKDGLTVTQFGSVEPRALIADEDCHGPPPIPFVDGRLGLRRSAHDVNSILSEGFHRFPQLHSRHIRKTEDASRACTDDFAVEETYSATQSNAPGGAERFADPNDSAGVARILKP